MRGGGYGLRAPGAAAAGSGSPAHSRAAPKMRPGANQLRPALGHSLLDVMPGASEQTRLVKIINANWVAGPVGDHGRFEVMIVTEDDRQHLAAPSPAALTARTALP